MTLVHKCWRILFDEYKDNMKELDSIIKSKDNPIPCELIEFYDHYSYGLNSTCDGVCYMVNIGYLDGIRYLHEELGYNSEQLTKGFLFGLEVIIDKCNPELLKYFIEILKISFNDHWIDYSCGSSLENVLYIHEKYGNVFTVHGSYNACFMGKMDIIKYLHKINVPFDDDSTSIACSHGYLDVLTFLYEKGVPITQKAMKNACRMNQLHIIKYLVEVVHLKPLKDIIDIAVKNCRLYIVRYLYEKANATCSQGAMAEACAYGRLDIVRYLHEVMDAPYTNKTINLACLYGHYDIVVYLCEVVKMTKHIKIAIIQAKKGKNKKIISYLEKLKKE